MEKLVKLLFVKDDSYWFLHLHEVFWVVNVVQVAILVFLVVSVNLLDPGV
jgi:hypothetical protein